MQATQDYELIKKMNKIDKIYKIFYNFFPSHNRPTLPQPYVGTVVM